MVETASELVRAGSAGAGEIHVRPGDGLYTRRRHAEIPLSVCLYTPSANPSGMGQHMLDLAEQYLGWGTAVTVMCWPTDPGAQLLRRARATGATAFSTPHPRDPVFADEISEHLRGSPVDVFHAHVGTGVENFDGARAARKAAVPAIVQTQHLPWRLRNRRKREPFFRSVREVDHVIAVSHAQRTTYEDIGLATARLTTVANGVSPRAHAYGRAAARARLDLTERQPVIMTVGRLTVMKGQRYLVECMPRLLEEFQDLQVLVLGSGHLHRALAEQAEALGVSEGLRLLGHRDDARALLDAADVFVLPSLHEGMPLAVVEAMDAGLPVVGTRVIGTSEIVEPGVTGLLVAPRDSLALGKALASVLRDPVRRSDMGSAGRLRYAHRFTSRRMAEDTMAVYRRVLRDVGSQPSQVRALA